MAIRDEFRRCQPFALKSRHGIAVVFSFFGDYAEVRDFMQNASNKTRAYFVNSNGLRGFVVSILLEVLIRAT